MTVRDVCIWVHSLRTWENSESRDKDNRGGEDVNKAIKYLFADGNKKRFIVVAYEYVTKRVANVKNDIYRSNTDNASSRIELSKISHDTSHALFRGK